ncbi:unnamed protein product [Symbiodinium sp. CCMP2592]|nr:unnamed protein product [Symbiodinium sp. CCMP2592]
MYCPGNVFPAYQLAGYWVEHSDIGGLSHYSVFSCRDASRCLAGDPGQCNVGRTGRACADCFRGYASDVDGSCKPCDALSMWPFLLLPIVMLGLLPLLVAASILMSRARRVAVSIFIVCVIFGQLVVCLQSLEAIYQFEITWIDPARAVLSSLAIFSLDIEFSCILDPQSHVVEYGSQLLAYPAVLLGTVGFWLLARWVKRPISFNSFLNLHGVLLVALLTAMSLTAMRPFQCRPNPNGLHTMSTRTDVICWSPEHGPLVVLASLGILAYPVAILSTIAFLTWKYPTWLRSGGGLEVLEKYKFLFGRFRPERYYYALLLSAHNMVVALIPAALVAAPALQVGIMGAVICTKLTAQSLLWPWRSDVANYNDLVLSTALLILLLLASPLLRLNQTDTSFLVAVLLACVLCVLPLAALSSACMAVSVRLRSQSKYDAFLCHHKAGAGALCRFFKLIVHKYGRMNIFLDSDELDDLARIFEIVSSDTRCLVAVLTPELLQRMWCAGEMTSARKYGIPIIPLYCDGFAFPDEDCINKIESVWTEEQQYTLTSHGIAMEDIKATYRHISTLEGYALSRHSSLEEQERLVLDVAAAVLRGARRADVAPQGSVSSARILLCSTEREPEAISTVLILQQMVQQQLRIATFRVRSLKDIAAASSASFALVLLSKGVLEDPDFALQIGQMRAQALSFVPVNDGTFQFPPSDFYMQAGESCGLDVYVWLLFSGGGGRRGRAWPKCRAQLGKGLPGQPV